MQLLTKEVIESLMTPAGGYNEATLAALDVSWPPQAGWKARLIGTEVADRKFAEAKAAAARGAIYRRRGNAGRRR